MTAPNNSFTEGGAVGVDVYPDGTHFESRLRQETLPAAERVGRDIGRRIGAQIAQPIIKAIADAVRQGGRDSRDETLAVGRSIGDRMGQEIRKRIESHLRRPLTVRVNADTSAAERALSRLGVIRRATVAVDADTGTAGADLAALRALVGQLGGSTGVRLDVDTGDALAEIGAVGAALGALHPLAVVSVDVDVAAALTEVASLESALSGIQQLTSQMPSLDLGTGTALSRVGQVQTAVSGLAQATSMNLDVDTAGASAQVAAFLASTNSVGPTINVRLDMPDADEIGRRIGREAGTEFARAFNAAVRAAPAPAPPGTSPAVSGPSGRRSGGAFGAQFRAAVEDALNNLPEPRLTLRRLSDDEREVRQLYRDLERLRDVEIGVDLDADQARREMTRIEGLLHGIQTRAARGTALDIDTAAAVAALNRFRQQLNNMGPDPARTAAQGAQAGGVFGRTYAAGVAQALRSIPQVQIDGNTDPITRDIEFVRRRLEFLSNARIGIDIDAAEAGREIDRLRGELIRLGQASPNIDVQADTAAAATQLGTLQAQLTALATQDPTVNVDVDTGAAQASLAGLTLSAIAARFAVASIGVAGLSLITVLIPAAAAAAAAIGAIGVAAFGAIAALGVAALAMSGVIGAVQAVNAAQEEAGASASQVTQQQSAMASAADSVRNAERGLASALKDVTRAQEDLTRARKEAKEAIEDLDLSVRGNRLAQERASDDLKEAAAELERVNAPGSGATDEQRREARLSYEEAKLRADELAVRGKRLAEDQQDAHKKGIEGSDQVRAAQDRIAAAQERVVQATQALAAAHRQQAQAATAAAGTTSAAAKKMQDALAALTPEGRRFALFLVGLKDELGVLRKAAEASFLPGLQRGIEAALPILPVITLMIQRFGGVLGKLAEDAGQALSSPIWTRFFEFLGTTGAKVFDLFARSAGNVIEAILSIAIAFGPFAEMFAEGLLDLTERFREWAEGLADSQGFRDFIEYAKTEGPKVLSVLGDLAVVAFKLLVALAPFGTLVLEGLVLLFDWLARLDPGVLLAIAAGIGAIAVAIALIAGGPVSLIVAGLTLVVGYLIYAYNEFETFRNIVDTSARAIAAASVWLWNTVLLPIFKAWWEFAQVMGRIYMWLWENAIKPAWAAISAAAVFAWENIIKPVLAAIVWYVTNILAPLWRWLYENVIKIAFDAIVLVIRIAWAAIQVIFGLIQIQLKILGAVFSWLWENVIGPVWRAISAFISLVWNEQIKPILQHFGDFIGAVVAPAVKKGVEAIGRSWDLMKELAKAPIRFVVETVLNSGLLAAYNWIANKFGVKPDNVKIPVPDWLASSGGGSNGASAAGFHGFAEGGPVRGPGTGTSDDIMARLSNGEYVIPAQIVAQLGVEFFDWLIGRKKAQGRNQRPGDGSEGLAFAEGGLVGWVKSAWQTLTDPIGALKAKAGEMLGGIPGGKWIKDILGGVAKDSIGKVADWVGAKIANLMSADGYSGPITADVANVRDFIAAQAGKPYIWAAAGPRGYDCSGIVSAAFNMLHGRSPYSHTFSTHYMHNYFRRMGQVGPLTAGWSHAGERGGGSVGHTAANIAGLPFESTGSVGVRVGARATPYTSFARWGTFDSGGWLMPGVTVAYNGTGRPEKVSTEAEWARMAESRSGGAGNQYITNVYPQRADFTVDDLESLDARRYAKARLRRSS